MPTWNSAFAATPSGGAPVGEGDDRIRELKTAIYERLAKELVMDLSSGLVSEDGWLKSGASKIYVGATEPTTRPDNITALSAADYGRLWYNTSDTQLYVYTSSGWITLPLVEEATHALSADSADAISGYTVAPGSGNIPVVHGYVTGSKTGAQLYALFDSLVPDVGDWIPVTGGVKDGNYLLTSSYLYRATSSGIVLNGLLTTISGGVLSMTSSGIQLSELNTTSYTVNMAY